MCVCIQTENSPWQAKSLPFSRGLPVCTDAATFNHRRTPVLFGVEQAKGPGARGRRGRCEGKTADTTAVGRHCYLAKDWRNIIYRGCYSYDTRYHRQSISYFLCRHWLSYILSPVIFTRKLCEVTRTLQNKMWGNMSRSRCRHPATAAQCCCAGHLPVIFISYRDMCDDRIGRCRGR